MGLLVAYLVGRPGAHRLARPFVGVGVLGGWTTFSALAVDVVHLGVADRAQAGPGLRGGDLPRRHAGRGCGIGSGTTGLARTMTPTDALLVALGAALGAPLRYLVNHWVRERLGGTPAAGTLVVNVAGSFVLGAIVGAGVGAAPLALIGIGFCGALTTFSTLALEVWDAMSDGRHHHAVANVALSLALGIGAASLGWVLAGG